MTARDNKWCAEAIVNRMWAHFMGRGIVEPIDDFRPSNPPTMPDVLKKLADDFVSYDYDLKRLIKHITSTHVYNLSSSHAKQIDPENIYYARFLLKQIGPEKILVSFFSFTNMNTIMDCIAL